MLAAGSRHTPHKAPRGAAHYTEQHVPHEHNNTQSNPPLDTSRPPMPPRSCARTRGTSTHHQTYQTKQGAPRPPPTQPTQGEPSGCRHTEMRATKPDSRQTPPRNLHPTVQAGKHCHTRPNPHNPRHGHKFNSDQTRRRAIAYRLLHRVCHEGYGWRLLLTASRAPLLMCTTTLDYSMGVHSHPLLPRWLSAEGAFTLVHLSSS